MVPSGAGCSNHPNQVLGVVGGVRDDPLLGGDPLLSISSFDSLDGGDSAVVPLDEGHGDCSGQVLDFVAGCGEDDPLLSGDSSFLSLPPQSFFRQP